MSGIQIAILVLIDTDSPLIAQVVINPKLPYDHALPLYGNEKFLFLNY